MQGSRRLVNALRRRRYRDDLFTQQRRFFDDPAKTKAACCSRRSGKTWACGAGLYEACEEAPGSVNPYIALTGVSARFIMWPVLVKMNHQYGWGLGMNDHELVARHPNGAIIRLVGGDDRRKVDSLRGGAYRRAVIDEAEAFPTSLLRYLSEDVLDAALLDWDGDQWLVGTPNAACAGHFHDLTTGVNANVAQIPTHHWTVADNPHIPHVHAWLARKRQERGWTEDHPTYRREYLGQWVRDGTAMVFRFDRSRHMIAELPPCDRKVCGVDLGISQKERTTAVVLVGWAKHDRRVIVRHARKFAGGNVDELGDAVKALGPDVVVVDEGVDLGYGYEWQRRHGLHVQAAKKREKKAYIQFLNTELDQGRLLFGPDTMELVEELELLQWDEEGKDYDKRFADHAADSMLYGWRECWSWTERPDPREKQPEPGTPEALDFMMAEKRRAALKAAKERDKMLVKRGRYPLQ